MASLKTEVVTTYNIELTEQEYIDLLQCILNSSTALPTDVLNVIKGRNNIDKCKPKEDTQDGKTK